jgi:outer membrane receptor protein involved in Fe transport
MKHFYKGLLAAITMVLLASSVIYAQTTIAGKVTDTGTGETIAGVNIVVKGKVIGTITDTKGQFSLAVNDAPPVTLVFSFVGYRSQEFVATSANMTGVDIKLEEQTVLGQEIVVSASRVEESIMRSPVTVEKIDLIGIQQTPAPEFYDALASVKGVQFTSSSLNFPQVNTRGFATIANVRFVQLVDGMDTSAPLLNFPTGNIVGIGELDAESMELVPGAASALYGPNAFNGILLMKSKSPFEYQGLSAQLKGGLTTSDAQGESYPFYNFGIRYAKAFNNRFAFKVNFSFMDAEDWRSNDYKTDVNNPESTVDLSGTPSFDAVNRYGDEARIPVPIGGTFGTLNLRRTGWQEEDIIDAYDAKSMKGDLALHYRVTDKIEALYNYRYGGGSSVYQGSQKYALRDFTQQFHKLELRSDNFFIRGYVTATDAGDSYNMAALGGQMNERISPTAAQWAPEYAQTYVLAMQGYVPGVPAGNPDAAHAAARAYADRNRPAVGSTEFKALTESVRNDYFQRTPGGAKFIDNSRLYHGEFNYNFKNQIKFAEIIVGGNVRQYNLFSDGTIFNEDPDDGNDFERVVINEYGVYSQISKTLADALKLTGSLRYDKNENFEGQITPRISAVYTFNENHNVRASFQTGFRNPDTQAQFIFFPVGTNTLLGSTEANAARYGVHNGGGWTRGSYEAYLASGGSLQGEEGTPTGGDPNLLVTANIPYVGPEKLQSFEVGYKGLFTKDILIDLNGYYTDYKDFIGSLDVASKRATTHQGNTINAGTIFSPYVNSAATVSSYGVGIGITYNLPLNYQLTANYNYATFEEDKEQDPNFRAGFNTPQNKFNIGIANRKVFKNVGFSVNYRWQDEFLWQSDFGQWNVPEFGVVDAQVSYKVSSIKTMVKIGGTNIGGGDYRTNLGGPFIGQQYFISLTFDEFLR